MNRRGFSPILASLLLIMLAIAGGTYFFFHFQDVGNVAGFNPYCNIDSVKINDTGLGALLIVYDLSWNTDGIYTMEIKHESGFINIKIPSTQNPDLVDVELTTITETGIADPKKRGDLYQVVLEGELINDRGSIICETVVKSR